MRIENSGAATSLLNSTMDRVPPPSHFNKIPTLCSDILGLMGFFAVDVTRGRGEFYRIVRHISSADIIHKARQPGTGLASCVWCNISSFLLLSSCFHPPNARQRNTDASILTEDGRRKIPAGAYSNRPQTETSSSLPVARNYKISNRMK